MAKAAAAASATVVMSNHTEFDRAHDRVRIAQLRRTAGEKHPYETDTATVLRYFDIGADGANASTAVQANVAERLLFIARSHMRYCRA